jgi:Mg2+-importing ATPase
VRWVDVNGAASEAVLDAAALNSYFETGIHNPLDEAILRVCGPCGDGWHKVDEIPFDFHRRRLSVVVVGASGCRMIVKGAPEGVFEACCSARDVEGMTWREQAEATFRHLSEAGLRVLAVAERRVDGLPPFEPEDERGLTLLGFLAFADQPREGIPEVLDALQQDGIRLVMLTGDNEWVTRRVCEAVGLDASRLMRGADLDLVRDDALPQIVREVNVFARLTPEQKHRVIEGLKRAGCVVGYLGDGINDTLALRKADVGISVMNAVPIAREAAAIILLQKRLDVLHQGVLEGRRSFVNVMKYVMMNASSNFGNMLSMAFAALFLPFLPLLPLQILLNNLLYDLSQVALASDTVDEWTLRTPRHWNVTAIWHFMWMMGPVSSLFDCLTFGVLLWIFAADVPLFRTGWFVESLLTQTLVILVLRSRGIHWHSRPSTMLIVSIVMVCSVACWLPYSRLAQYFDFIALPPHVLGTMVVLAMLYLITAYRVNQIMRASTLIQT